VLGAVNVTVTPGTPLPPPSFTVAWKGVAKGVLTVALCGVPLVGAMLAGEPALTRIFALVPVIVALVVSVATILWFPRFSAWPRAYWFHWSEWYSPQHRLRIRAGEVHRARIAGHRVVERIFRRHREIKRGPYPRRPWGCNREA